MMNYSTRPLSLNDAGSLDAFLHPHTAEAYYLRSNALAGGLAYDGKYLQAEYLGAFLGENLVGVICYSWINTILVYAHELNCLPALAQAISPLIKKRDGIVEAFIGLAPHVDSIVKSLKIPSHVFRKHGSAGLYKLPIEKLRLPEILSDTRIRQAEEKDKEQLIAWRIDFNIESAKSQPGPELEKKVREEISQRLPLKEFFLLESNDTPVAMCGVGGHVPDTAMVGPVWTPTELRCRGYGRAVTAGAIKMLSDERPTMTQAVLAASRPDAIHAYEAIGFERLADWNLALLKEDYRFLI
ncbi:MAG: hypothetical protein PHX43_05620 [Alphaproteobacteria bacterium]|nr:hypothetical protein [Alphaproteobacteria bacterium]